MGKRCKASGYTANSNWFKQLDGSSHSILCQHAAQNGRELFILWYWKKGMSTWGAGLNLWSKWDIYTTRSRDTGSEVFFKIKLLIFLDILTQKIIFLIVKIINFWGDLSGISAKTATLHVRFRWVFFGKYIVRASWTLYTVWLLNIDHANFQTLPEHVLHSYDLVFRIMCVTNITDHTKNIFILRSTMCL